MRSHRRKYHLIIFFIIVCDCLFSLTGYGQFRISEADSINRKNLIEEIYLQTDRDIYFSGERVWIKVIKMERMTGLPVSLSKVLYLEMLGGKDNVISQSKIYASGDCASGIISLPDTLSTGNYLIRAYTSWMKNYPDDLKFYRYISVINPFKGYEKMVRKSLLKENNRTNSDPGSRLSYTQGNSGKPEQTTFKIMADDPQTPLAVRIIYNAGVIRPGETGRIVIKTAGLASIIKEFRFGTDTLLKIPREIIPHGVSEIILTDEPGEIISSRWFCNFSRNFTISVDTDTSEYQPRQKVKIGVSVTDKSNNHIESTLSVSVVKKSLLFKNRIDLTSVDGLIRSGNTWFFSSEPSQVNNFLLKYTYNNSDSILRRADRILFLPELEGEILRGVIKDRTTGNPMGNTDISVSFVGKNSICQFARTDADGRFSFNINITGLREIVIQPMDPENKSYFVELDQPFSNTFSNLSPPSFVLDSTLADELNNAVVAMQVNSIYEPFRQKIQENPQEIVALDFYGEPDKRIMLADYIELTTIKEVVKEIIPGLSVIRKNRQQVFKLINNYPFAPFENMALVLVDGVPVYDIGKLLEVSSKEIERIDIFNRRYFYSNYVFDGILSFVSKRGDHSSLETENGIFRQVYEGYQRKQSFYSPVYNTEELKSSKIPDFRNTLYWEPVLSTDNQGKTYVEFYTSDEKGEYIIIVEGLTKDGRKGSATSSFVVR